MNDAEGFYQAGGTRDEYVTGYIGQLQYINKRVIELVDNILSMDDGFSVIVLQGDHGPRSMVDWNNLDRICWEECYSILNAYYLPDNDYRTFHESMTPVNTFRIIFNRYFGTNYRLLKDTCYFLGYESRDFIDVTNNADSCTPAMR